MRFLSTFTTFLLIPLVAVLPVQACSTGSAAEAVIGSVPTSQPNTLQIRLADAAQSVVQANSTFKGYAILVTDASGAPVADAAVALRLPDEGPTGFFSNGDRSSVAYTSASGVATFAQINWNSVPGSALIRITVVKGDQHAGALLEESIVSQLPAATATPAPSAVLKPLAPQTAPGQAAAVVPGTPVSVAAVHTGAADTPHSAHPDDKPAAPAAQPASSPEPVVSIVNTAGSAAPHSNKKWILLAVVGVAAGVGAALALSGKGAAPVASSSTTSLSIGSPSISVGH